MSKKVCILYAPVVYKNLKRLDKKVARRIALKIEENAMMSNPLARAKALVGKLSGYYRYRIGDYRVIFSMNEQGQISVLKVLSIKHRKDVYRL